MSAAHRSTRTKKVSAADQGSIEVQSATWDQAIGMSESIMESIDEAERKGLEPSESEIAAVARRVKEARRALRGLEEAIAGVSRAAPTLDKTSKTQLQRQDAVHQNRHALRKPAGTKRPRGVARSVGRSGHLKGSADESDALSIGFMASAPTVGVPRETPHGPVVHYATPSFRQSAGAQAVATGQTAGSGVPMEWSPPKSSDKALQRPQAASGAMLGGAVGTSQHGPHYGITTSGASSPTGMDGSQAHGLTLQSIPPPPPPPGIAATGGARDTAAHPPLTMTRRGRTAWSRHAAQAPASTPVGAPGALGWGMGQGRGIFSSQLREEHIGGRGGHGQQPQSGAMQSSPVVTPTAALVLDSGSTAAIGLGGSGGPWAAPGSSDIPHGTHPVGAGGPPGARGMTISGQSVPPPGPWGEGDRETMGGYTPSSSSGNTFESFEN